jgi:predicted RNase H-like HicB family nuclease
VAKLIYPAVLERGAKRSFGVWFPDFAQSVAGGTSPELAIEKAQSVLARALTELAEKDKPLPQPTSFEEIELPKDCDFVAFFAIAVEPPDPSERVNVYLPKSLIARVDSRAAELGMSRSSFFGLAVSSALGIFGNPRQLALSHRLTEELAVGLKPKPEKRSPRK